MRSAVPDWRISESARIRPIDWLRMSAPKFAPAIEAPTRLAPVRSAAMRAPERSAPSRRARTICEANRFAPFRLAPVRSASSSHAWSRMARSSLCAGELCLVEPCRAENRTGQIEPGEVEAGQSLSGEIGGCGDGCCAKRGLDLSAGHFGRDHIWRRQVDVTHHVLRRRRHGHKTQDRALRFRSSVSSSTPPMTYPSTGLKHCLSGFPLGGIAIDPPHDVQP